MKMEANPLGPHASTPFLYGKRTDGLLGFCSLTPTVRSQMDGVARALLCVELKPCRLHVTAPKPSVQSELPDLQKRRQRSDEGGHSINCT
jgi:hypothetical protein